MKNTKQTLVLLAMIFMLALGVATPTFAHRGGDDNGDVSTSNTGNNNTETEVETEDEVEHIAETEAHMSREDKTNLLNERIADRRAELEAKFKAKQEERKAKLEGKRLKVCEKRETRINELLQSSAERTKKKLAVFQKIQAGVEKFYETKGLSAEGYEAAVARANEKEAAAIAAIDAMAGVAFSCDTVDGNSPSGVIATAAKARYSALKDYKSAVRDIIIVVKQALNEQETSTDTSESGQ